MLKLVPPHGGKLKILLLQGEALETRKEKLNYYLKLE